MSLIVTFIVKSELRACIVVLIMLFFFFQAEDGIRDLTVTGVQTCALPICGSASRCYREPAGSGGRRPVDRPLAMLRSPKRRRLRPGGGRSAGGKTEQEEIGRASCRERV